MTMCLLARDAMGEVVPFPMSLAYILYRLALWDDGVGALVGSDTQLAHTVWGMPVPIGWRPTRDLF
jgi:hypothetical protein